MDIQDYKVALAVNNFLHLTGVSLSLHTCLGRPIDPKGFLLGDSPYVSCVDPDGMVIPGAFQACIEALESHPQACGAYTDEYMITEKGKVIRPGIWSGREWNPLLQLEPKYVHHIYVMRRKYIELLIDELHKWPNLSEFVVKCLITDFGPWIHVNRFGYKWRLHTRNPSHRGSSLMAVYAARWRVIPSLQRAAKRYQTSINPTETSEKGSD
jgi:hypothetical protein